MKTSTTFSTADALQVGWEKTLAHWRPLFTVGAVALLLSLLNQSLARSGSLGAFLALGVQLVQFAVGLVMAWLALNYHDGHHVELERWRDQLPNYVAWLLTCVAFGLVMGVGLLLLIVPGIIWGVQFAFAPLLNVDRSLDPFSAMRESSRLTQGLRWQLFVFALACAGLNFVGAVALGVGLLLTIPTTLIAGVHVMRALQARAGADLSPRIHPTTLTPAS